MVELEPLDPAIKSRLDAWAGCLSGTIPIDQYRAALLKAGFKDPDFNVHATESMPGVEGKIGSAYIRARKPGEPSAPDRAASKLPAHEDADHHQWPQPGVR